MVGERVEDAFRPIAVRRSPHERVEIGVVDHRPATGAEYPIELVERCFDIVHVLVRLHGRGRVERLVRDGQAAGVGLRERYLRTVGTPSLRVRECGRAPVDPVDAPLIADGVGELGRLEPGAATDGEHVFALLQAELLSDEPTTLRRRRRPIDGFLLLDLAFVEFERIAHETSRAQLRRNRG